MPTKLGLLASGLPAASAARVFAGKASTAAGIHGWEALRANESVEPMSGAPQHSMQFPIKVLFQGAAAPPEVEASVLEAVAQMEDFCGHITGCQVFLYGPAANDDQSLMISLKLWTPDAEITIAGGRPHNPERRGLKAALQDAFTRAHRELSMLELPQCTCKPAAREPQTVNRA